MADLRSLRGVVAKHVKSNAIVYVKDGANGGRRSRGRCRGSIPPALLRARPRKPPRWSGLHEPLTRGSVVASDAFFPFADGLVATIEAGATAVIQPGGSVRDAEVIAVADAADVAMVFTGMRHFRH